MAPKSPVATLFALQTAAASPITVSDTLQISEIPVEGYERVVRGVDPQTGLHAIIAVHDTTLGPALGGLRMWNYASEEDALFDVLRLSKGMTYKSAVAHTGLGGGKAVMIGDSKTIKSEGLYLAMGRLVDSLGGLYTTAEDVNTSIGDLEIVRRATKYVTGLSRADGGSGNPSPYTAYGVYLGVRAALGWAFDNDDPKGKTIAIQGVGAVGGPLAERLAEAGATVYAADRNQARLDELTEKHGVKQVKADEILGMECDLLAPCALGGILNDESIPQLRTKAVAGAANNLLLKPEHGKALSDRGILYAPDYVINAGGIVNVSVEFHDGGYNEEVALRKIERIPQALKELWTISKEEGIPSSDAADRLAQRIVAEGRATKA
ncbi:MAG: leucine dehydrogenase [Planctomycetota bacterium]